MLDTYTLANFTSILIDYLDTSLWKQNVVIEKLIQLSYE